MKYQHECIACSKKQGQRIFQVGLESDNTQSEKDSLETLNRELDDLIDHADRNLSPADLSFLAIRAGEKHSGNSEPFKTTKSKHNQLALGLYDELKAKIKDSQNSLHTACQLSASAFISRL